LNLIQALGAFDTERIYDKAFTFLQGFKHQFVDDWDNFSQEVYDLHRCPTLFTTSRQEKESIASMSSHIAATSGKHEGGL
jgi:hypothetical protein